ncbi:hypothetical protein NW110_08375 [Staphylococcus pettenkoferi]|uniref:hypothetical protein n=1 Tax=Staphylococcus pettenkoferi TaxID=170573 RepID=UPI0016425BFF|nr:hypothetical protein [Staphylococcus pettenkoferi]MCY1572241.1 hypothetical protein [Staphylococcus pettenkoferi]MCY1589193.1 hypothetical protein [Staphylococcus pettenkoferi]MCY1596336.1 hypothetical protein [Staphylococcus pettenkoferi]MCY1601755.1 hypothetical protein [Staphylococcus pettenkoferi]MCY1607905.1 hypothetical protein [Staphylococcus pettenkoferi]
MLTETAQKYLDDSNALAVANHLKEELNTELDNLSDLYNHTIANMIISGITGLKMLKI